MTSSPSTVVEAVDPGLERAILRCLEPDPAQRPRSALAVAAALPGGDPLAAALEAGETPSPDMVAAAGEEGRLRPLVAWSLLGGVVVALVGLCLLASRYYIVNYVSLPLRPAVLEAHATEIVRALGYTDPPADKISGLNYDDVYLDYVTKHDSSLSRWQKLSGDPSAILFWYRQSPMHMRQEGFGRFRVQYDDPPPLQSGMVRLQLDPAGHLVHFHAVPAEIDSTPSTAPTPDEERRLLAMAGLDPARFTPVPSVWVPPVQCDMRRAWTGTLAARDDLPLRLEAGWHAGRLAFLERLGPWREPQALQAQKSRLARAGGIVSTLLILSLLIGSVLRARTNFMQGRGDRRGAARLALFIFALHLTIWIFVTNHTTALTVEVDMLIEGLAIMVFLAGFFWVVYIALEPHMRRTWPDLIISWTRLLSGRIRDPLVGRDILVGVLLGSFCVLLMTFEQAFPKWLGIAPHYPEKSYLFTLFGVPQAALAIVNVLAESVLGPLATVLFLLGMCRLVRHRMLAAVLVVLALGFLVGSEMDPSGAHPQTTIPMGLVVMALWMIVVLRYGMLALVTLSFVTTLLDSAPLAASPSAWYAGCGAVALVVTVALALFGWRNALGHRRA